MLTVSSANLSSAAPAASAPAPEVEYVYKVIVRRHFDFPYSDALGYGWGVATSSGADSDTRRVMTATKSEVFPNDEQAANFVVSNAVGVLCPAQIWWLRNSAAGYRPPGREGFGLICAVDLQFDTTAEGTSDPDA